MVLASCVALGVIETMLMRQETLKAAVLKKVISVDASKEGSMPSNNFKIIHISGIDRAKS
jgi:hypothetical protein